MSEYKNDISRVLFRGSHVSEKLKSILHFYISSFTRFTDTMLLECKSCMSVVCGQSKYGKKVDWNQMKHEIMIWLNALATSKK